MRSSFKRSLLDSAQCQRLGGGARRHPHSSIDVPRAGRQAPARLSSTVDRIKSTHTNRSPINPAHFSRNARLAAIRSFAHFAALKDPTALPSLQGVLAIPMKRFDKPLLGFLSKCEMQAILNAPPADRWSGQRDRIMFATLYNTGARVSELTGLRVADVVLDGSPCVHLHGKGRKDRSVPLWPTTTTQVRRWLPWIDSRPDRPLFPSTRGGRLARPAVTARLRLAVQRAVGQCPSLANRHISPHCVRHSTAMHMLQAGVDITVIALWLGHENPATTHMYVEADLAMKERALQAVQPPHMKQTRYRPTDRLLGFLQGL